MHPEKVQSAIDRYANETRRCWSVLETRLAAEKTNYIVGGQLSIADIAFYPWVKAWDYVGGLLNLDDYPYVRDWIKNLEARESLKKAYKLNQ